MVRMRVFLELGCWVNLNSLYKDMSKPWKTYFLINGLILIGCTSLLDKPKADVDSDATGLVGILCSCTKS